MDPNLTTLYVVVPPSPLQVTYCHLLGILPWKERPDSRPVLSVIPITTGRTMVPEMLDAAEHRLESLRRRPRGISGAWPDTGPASKELVLESDDGDLKKQEVDVGEGRLDQIVHFNNGTKQINEGTIDVGNIGQILDNAKSETILNDFDIQSIKDDRGEEILEERSLPTLNLSSSNNIGRSISNSLTQSSSDMVEVDLKRYLEQPEAYNFYCPECNCCMDKVILKKMKKEPDEAIDTFTCMSCFNVLILAGRRFVSLCARGREPKPTRVSKVLLDPSQPIPSNLSANLSSNVYSSKPQQGPGDPKDVVINISASKALPDPSQPIPSNLSANLSSVVYSSKPLQGPGDPDDVVINISGAKASVIIPSGELANLEAQEGIGWDVLKSIVYGGLIETITSLGIVTSAAAANAGTVKILALGLANLIGGLIVLGHYIWDLKADGFRLAPNQINTPIDQYQEVLGHRRNFLLHSILAVLSFLVFGMVPLITYVFSFPQSDITEFKLAIAIAASVVCIILLAAGKAHIQRPRRFNNYLKTILYYFLSGVGTSGVSYIIGTLFMKLVEKLGWFNASQDLSSFIAQTAKLVMTT